MVDLVGRGSPSRCFLKKWRKVLANFSHQKRVKKVKKVLRY